MLAFSLKNGITIDSAVRSLGTSGTLAAEPKRAVWTAGQRHADLTLVPPLNSSLALATPGQADVTTWYPVDKALVGVISHRIAGFFREPENARR